MSNICKRIAKPKKPCWRKVRQANYRRLTNKYTSFNIVNPEGKNVIIHTDTPMTEYEVYYKYGYLNVSGIE